jgi:hypothetical protein
MNEKILLIAESRRQSSIEIGSFIKPLASIGPLSLHQYARIIRNCFLIVIHQFAIYPHIFYSS